MRFDTPRPLRKPGSSRKRRLSALRADVEREVSKQLDDAGRKAFRGRIAVQLDVATAKDAPRLWTMAKAYVDALTGSIIRDDALVEHLIVTHSTNRDRGATAIIQGLPIPVFVAEFDRAFRLADEIGFGYEERPPPLRNGARVARDPNEWGLARFDDDARWMLGHEQGMLDRVDELDAEYEWQMQQDPDGEPELYLSDSERELADPDVREQVRRHHGRSTARSRAHQFADQGFDVRDRPGPAPGWLAEVEHESPAELVELRNAGPGCVVLPPPPLRPSPIRWDATVRRELAASWQHVRHAMHFPGPLALDVAAIGGAAPTKDIDNLAHELIDAVEEILSHADAQVSGYRAYRLPGAERAVRLRVMPIGRLRMLVRSMHDAAEVIKRERASRARS